MTWQVIDFQRIIILDQSLVEQLKGYLQEKETALGSEILASLPLGREGITPPRLEPSQLVRLSLSDAVDGFAKKIRGVLAKEPEIVTSANLKQMTDTIDNAFLNHVEVLEGAVRELFLQVDQIGLENWTTGLLKSLDSFQDLFFHSIENAMLAFDRVEGLLREFRGGFSFTSVLEKPDLKGLLSFLKARYKKASRSLQGHLDLESRVHESAKKLETYEVLSRLDETHREKYKKIYFYTKLGQIEPCLCKELMRALSHAVSEGYAIEIFRDYLKALYSAHYHQSRVLKKENKRYLADPGGLERILDVMKGYHAEILTLGSTVTRYRDLLLKTDPNPYVRSKWGFTEGIVAPEPKAAKTLHEMELDVDSLKRLNDHLLNSIEKAEKTPSEKIPMSPWTHKLIYEMGQPLTSQAMAKSRAEKVLEDLDRIDEIGSTNMYTIDYTGDILSRLLRADWKYHVLHEIPLFNELMKNHIGILGFVDDRRHLNRMNKFLYVTKELTHWFEKHETRKHEREIEFDVNDLKIYLQDFLALVQRTDDKGKLDELSYLLLLYRRLFGEFFHRLVISDEGRRLRLKLLFVDQYFESIDKKLFELK